MRLRQALSVSLAAVLALLAPGPQAWAAMAKTSGAAPGQSLPAAQIVVSPTLTTGSLGSLSSGISLDLGGRLGAAAPQVKAVGLTPAAIQPASLPQAPAPAPAPAVGNPVSAEIPNSVGPLAPVTVTAAPRPGAGSETSAKVGAIATESTPILSAVTDREASPADLRSGAGHLQRVLEGGLGLNAAPADIEGQPFSSTEKDANRVELAPAQDATAAADKPLPEPELSPRQKSKFRFYSGAVSAVKVGIEALNLAVPLLLLNTLHAAMAVSTLYLAAEVASIFSSLIGGAIVDRIGARRALVLTGFTQAAAIVGVPLAIASGGALALPLVYVLFMLNGVASELFEVARRSALPQIVGQDEGLLRKKNGSLYVWREIAATAGVFGAGWLVHHVGALSTIWMHPAFCLTAAFAALRLLRSGGHDGEKTLSSPEKKPGGLKASLRSWWADLVDGARYVVSEKKMRTIVLVNMPLNALHKIFHTLVAVIYAAQVLRNPAMAAVLLGAWNVGELAGAFYLERRGKSSRLSNWMRLAAGASLSLWAYWLFPSAWVAIPISFFLAAAMIGNEVGTASYMQSTVPEQKLGSVTGFVYGFARAAGMAALLLSGFAFDALGPMGGFLALAAIFTVFAPIYLLASRRFKGEKIDTPANMPED